jgi:AraC-like DNA-binding protein
MIFERLEPSHGLSHLVECYWMMRDDDATPRQQKIIPDGFTEIIFHFGDPYKVCLNNQWNIQPRLLLAGQIKKHFYLENTGSTDILGIKFKPTALSKLFGLHMGDLKHEIVDLKETLAKESEMLENEIRGTGSWEEKVAALDSCLLKVAGMNIAETNADRAVNMIFNMHGMISVTEICDAVNLGERQLENIFKRDVGLSPKLFCRVVRFRHIFDLAEGKNANWSDLAYAAAFYDQSHFIRNFRDFTGENPTNYIFGEKNMANFFLRKNKW